MATVSISDTSPRVQYSVSATPTTGPFTVSFPFFDLDDLVVYDGETLLVRTTDYTVAGTAVDDGYSGGTVTLVSNTSNTTITILRDIPVERTTDFPTSGYFSVAALNTALDKIFAILQQIETGVARTLRLKDTAGNSVTLTVDDPEAGKVLEWNSSGTGIQNSTISLSEVGTSATNAAASASAASTSATAAATSATASAASATSASASATAAAASAASAAGIGGPASSTDNTWPRFDGTAGDQIQAGTWVENDSGNVTAGGTLDMNGYTITLDAVTLSGTVSAADQLIQRPKFQDVSETVVTANSTTTYTCNLESGNVFKITLTGNCTFTFSNPPATGSYGAFRLELIQDGTGSRSATWPASVDWPSGSAPTLTSTATTGKDVLFFETTDGGTTWLGYVSGQDFQ